MSYCPPSQTLHSGAVSCLLRKMHYRFVSNERKATHTSTSTKGDIPDNGLYILVFLRPRQPCFRRVVRRHVKISAGDRISPYMVTSCRCKADTVRSLEVYRFAMQLTLTANDDNANAKGRRRRVGQTVDDVRDAVIKHCEPRVLYSSYGSPYDCDIKVDSATEETDGSFTARATSTAHRNHTMPTLAQQNESRVATWPKEVLDELKRNNRVIKCHFAKSTCTACDQAIMTGVDTCTRRVPCHQALRHLAQRLPAELAFVSAQRLLGLSAA